MEPPGANELLPMVRAQLPALAASQRDLVEDFLARAPDDALARDQLLNAVVLTTSGAYTDDQEARQGLIAEV